ncbi:MAG TPA: glycosyltransferase family 39 protein [Candidatus Woesebacteria bacterium]|jgi:4-amino-4-deoxy-L-arabinose transferase-like glycosyltransferase|nr:glycosyltransferase family 39 protein [Candidatus Woesebacteria bacterium]HNS65243.1 glycosyltransferase family 39 protein [Candidatus Woesebacteria bacterium]
MATVLDTKKTPIMKIAGKLPLLFIVLIAGLLRFWQLGNIPAGPNWDEAAIGYNGWSVWQTRRDEWLERLPISFRSFGDYKAPLAIYANGLFTSLFGLNVWVIRLPFALSGVLGVVCFYYLISNLLALKQKQKSYSSSKWLAVIGSATLAISPWHILFSRVGFESGLALTEVILATALLILSVQKKWPRWQVLGLQIASGLIFASTFYTYHSAKVMVPIFLVFLLLLLQRSKLLSIKHGFLYLSGIIVAIIPFILDSLLGEGLARASVTIFAQTLSFPDLITTVVQNTLAHLNPKFLVMGQADSIRHSIGSMGVLFPSTAFLAIIGFIFSLRGRRTFIWQLSLIWIVAGLVPAIIGVEVPHPNRALLALPGFLLLALLGLDHLTKIIFSFVKPNRKIQIALICFLVVVEITQLSLFLHQYFGTYNRQSSSSFQDGYSEMFAEVWSYYDGNNGKHSVDQIVITSEYGQPYIYALLTRKISTFQYHNGALINFLFPDVVQLSDLDRPNALVVAGEKSDLIDRTKAIKVIYANDGQPRFWLFDTNLL